MFYRLLFPTLFLIGLYALIKCITRLINIYDGDKTEFPAAPANYPVILPEAGTYEIAYKRTGYYGFIPRNIAFKLVSQPDRHEIKIRNGVNHFGSRKISGSRIIPVADFIVASPGTYEITVPVIAGKMNGDRLIITPKTGTQGFIMIFGTVASGIITIATAVLSLLAFANKW